MIDVMILADVGGRKAVTQFQIEGINWLPLDADHQIEANTIPRYIHEINFMDEKTIFRQVNPYKSKRRWWLFW